MLAAPIDFVYCHKYVHDYEGFEIVQVLDAQRVTAFRGFSKILEK